MATPTLTSAFFRRIARLGSTKASSKGELLASVSDVWFLIFLLVPILIVVFFGFTTVNQDLTISYSRLTGANYLGALDPFGPVATLFVRTLGVAFMAAVGSLVIAFPIAYYLARVCRERNRGLLVSLFVIPFWISFVVQVYAVRPWVRRDGYVGIVLDRIGLGSLADWIFKTVGLGSPGIVVPVLIYIWLPFMILPLFTAILRIDPALIEAAQDLGAGSWKTFWNVVVPLSYNGILTGTILVFITAFGSFVEPKILAGSSGLLIGNYIQASFLEFGKLPDGAAASVVVLVPTIVLLYVYVAYAQAPATGLARERDRADRPGCVGPPLGTLGAPTDRWEEDACGRRTRTGSPADDSGVSESPRANFRFHRFLAGPRHPARVHVRRPRRLLHSSDPSHHLLIQSRQQHDRLELSFPPLVCLAAGLPGGLVPVRRHRDDWRAFEQCPYRTRRHRDLPRHRAARRARDRAVPVQLETVPQPHAVHGAHDPEHHPRVVPSGLHPPRRRPLPVALPGSHLGLRLCLDHRRPCDVLHPDRHRRADRELAGIRPLHRRGRDGPRGQRDHDLLPRHDSEHHAGNRLCGAARLHVLVQRSRRDAVPHGSRDPDAPNPILGPTLETDSDSGTQRGVDLDHRVIRRFHRSGEQGPARGHALPFLRDQRAGGARFRTFGRRSLFPTRRNALNRTADETRPFLRLFISASPSRFSPGGGEDGRHGRRRRNSCASTGFGTEARRKKDSRHCDCDRHRRGRVGRHRLLSVSAWARTRSDDPRSRDCVRGAGHHRPGWHGDSHGEGDRLERVGRNPQCHIQLVRRPGRRGPDYRVRGSVHDHGPRSPGRFCHPERIGHVAGQPEGWHPIAHGPGSSVPAFGLYERTPDRTVVHPHRARDVCEQFVGGQLCRDRDVLIG